MLDRAINDCIEEDQEIEENLRDDCNDLHAKHVEKDSNIVSEGELENDNEEKDSTDTSK